MTSGASVILIPHADVVSLRGSDAAGRLAIDLATVLAQREPPILVFGELRGPLEAVAISPDVAARVQLGQRFGIGLITAAAWASVPEWDLRLLVHNLVVHLAPGALVITDVDDPGFATNAAACGLEHVQLGSCVAYRRTERTTIHDLVAEARSGLKRLSPAQLAAHLATDPGCVVLDTRTPTDRERFGVIANSVHMPRTTLEWMCDPASGYSHERIVSFDQALVAVCNEGYSSSLSAASLQRLGFVNATDLIGGVMGWKDAGYLVESPDHTRFN
jgi:rhodanese-related sulfurtransferase